MTTHRVEIREHVAGSPPRRIWHVACACGWRSGQEVANPRILNWAYVFDQHLTDVQEGIAAGEVQDAEVLG